ncbi:DUF3306 domain-containing protein [Halomonas rhizosphaerae]|uniref:DUF3306 domain-containing protein n=1 Tax=Halomonas rhizosphaerae TaxID=3043296 RepID=A0ABT6V181_9GAMM|nr:DUF3306 domain-containing protein [Halomonas rhizosphaerae]MDI5891984.1 DUF3306 domain-containing protein [Halomonas rhizosphaerae]MDI5920576.1 DUF3306 domain-containing protein [Halomonas rhizosphaerae]
MSRFERWSRLKRGELASSETPLPPRGAEAREDDAPDREPLESDHTERDTAPSGSPAPGSLDHTLPDPEALPPGSDIKAYLASGVSSGLRKRALRRLFAADHYGIRDGLDDYDHDYREKLQPLAGEVAERLRNWTRRQLDEDEAPQEHASEVSEASPPDTESAATGQVNADDDTAMASREQDEDEVRENLTKEAGRPSGAP